MASKQQSIMNKSTTNIGLGGQAKAQVIDSKTGEVVPFLFQGEMVTETPWKHNLMLNEGMNKFGSYGINWAVTNSHPTSSGFLSRCEVGTGSSENKFVPAGVTASQSGNTITLSASVPTTSSHVGRVIKWDSGETAFITVVDGTTWTAKESQTVASGPFTIYRTNRVGLQSSSKSSPEGGSNIHYDTEDAVGAYFEIEIAYTFSVEAANVNYNECGIRDLQGVMFSRVVFSSSITVLEGQQIRVVYRFRINVSPKEPVASSLEIGGWDTGAVTQSLAEMSKLLTTQISSSLISPNNSMNAWLHKATELPSLTTGSATITPRSDKTGDLTWAAYVVDSFRAQGTFVFSPSQGNGTGWRGIVIGSAGSNNNVGFACLFENPVDKLDTYSLTFSYELTWERSYD